MFMEVKMCWAKMASLPMAQVGGVQPRSTDFLAAAGCLRVQACGGLAAGFAGAAFCFMGTKPLFRRDLLVISLFSWTVL